MTAALRILAILGSLVLVAWGLLVSDDLSDSRWLLFLFGAWILLLLGTRVSLPAGMSPFNKGLIRTILVVATVFVMITVQLARVQVIQQDAVYYRTATDPNNGEVISNPRLYQQELSVQRGRIYDRNGAVLADTTNVDGNWIRSWPEASVWPVTGYYSPTMYGSTGLEATYEQELNGDSGVNPVANVLRSLFGQEPRGSDLTLTLDLGVQSQAAAMLGTTRGSVIVMDVQTGAVVAMASYPTVDPNQLFIVDNRDAANSYWTTLNADDAGRPFVARANQGVYTPGSTFKTITAGIAIDAEIAGPETVYHDNGELMIDGRALPENNRPDPTRTDWTLREGVMWSLNVVLAQVGIEVGRDRYLDYSQEMGFGETIPFDLPVAESQLANTDDFLEDTNGVADTGFGQGELLMTPLHLAMVASMWANDGAMMHPYLVASVRDAEGNVVYNYDPTVWRQPFSAESAEQVRQMMIDAVNEGSIQQAITPGFVIGGKTGTAELGDGTTNSLFIGFIGDPQPRYAVSVVLEGGNGGLTSAVGIGRDILVAAIDQSASAKREFPRHIWVYRSSQASKTY